MSDFQNNFHYVHMEEPEISKARNRQHGYVNHRRSNEIVIARASIELYNAYNGDPSWTMVGEGAIHIIENEHLHYLVLVDEASDQNMWQRQITRNIVYKIDKPYFHIVCDKDELYGLNFADLTEAEMFFYAIDRLWPFRSLGKMISKFTTRFTNIFAKKRVASLPDNANSQRFRNVTSKPSQYFNSEIFYSDQIPTKLSVNSDANQVKIKRKGSFNRDKHINYTYDYDGVPEEEDEDDYQRHRFKVGASRVPKPPPLPPPVQNFHYASTCRNMDSRSYGGSASSASSNYSGSSFKAQIKDEARKHSLGNSFYKYLP